MAKQLNRQIVGIVKGDVSRLIIDLKATPPTVHAEISLKDDGGTPVEARTVSIQPGVGFRSAVDNWIETSLIDHVHTQLGFVDV